jgi:1,4-alpha-glucan branching enzyme
MDNATIDDIAAAGGTVERLLEGRLHDPFSFLGPHRTPKGWIVRIFNPHARAAWIATPEGWHAFAHFSGTGLYTCASAANPGRNYRLRFQEPEGTLRETHDPYAFAPTISDHDLHLFGAGTLEQAWRALGAQPLTLEGIAGVRFAVWAPNAERVSVVGDFNRWDGRIHPMAARGSSGVWELFVPDIAPDSLYKFEIRNRNTGMVLVKADPYARAFQLRPDTAARVPSPSGHLWRDGLWMERRATWDWLHAPVSIYEVHLGSWRRHADGRVYSYAELADALVPYMAELAFTHLELLPISEHPLDESWGYQTTGYFAPTSRFGDADGLRVLIDRCHQAGIAVILDWVPGHFPQDAWALARFDGTALYEHEDPRLGVHHDWGTHVFNYGRNEVRSFLLSSAHYWLAEFHFDGLRVDAVASMLYLDYSRREGQWLPNRYGGRENLEAIEFLRELNKMVHREFPGAITIAEESTAWPQVSRPAYLGGLGFSMKWNMGWMHDTLDYLHHDPVYRRFHHEQLTFGQLYAYTENFVLPFSHDEVVHGKGSLVTRAPGDAWRKFAGVRLLLAYQATYPGKKLNFMGNEFAQACEWQPQSELDWKSLAQPGPAGVRNALRDLNHLYRSIPALHELDFSQEGFAWIDCHDADQSVIVYQRRASDGSFVVVALNFTPVPRPRYRIGVPTAGNYTEIFNSDSRYYGGSDLGNAGAIATRSSPWMGLPCSLAITLPPLAALILARAQS